MIDILEVHAAVADLGLSLNCLEVRNDGSVYVEFDRMWAVIESPILMGTRIMVIPCNDAYRYYDFHCDIAGVVVYCGESIGLAPNLRSAITTVVNYALIMGI